MLSFILVKLRGGLRVTPIQEIFLGARRGLCLLRGFEGAPPAGLLLGVVHVQLAKVVQELHVLAAC